VGLKNGESKTQQLMRLVPRWDLSPRGHSLSVWHRMRAEQVFVISFAALIVVGTLGLWLIPDFHAQGDIRFIDALFTITSAVCVTGLTVVDTATFFTFWGQLWILIFIQLGGLGIITLTSIIIIALGRKLSLRSEEISSGGMDVAPKLSRVKLIRDIFLFTLLIESLGAGALYWLWSRPDVAWQTTLWHSVFHSVSAFCNAGFSTYSDNMVSRADSVVTLVVIGGLVVMGGIGFLVMEEVFRVIRSGDRRSIGKISLHTKIVVSMTVLLIALGAVGYALLEWNNVLKGLSTWDKLGNSVFMSITPRTAGFNTIDYAQCHAGTNFMTVLLMTIGGSPGSTAGGLKTTTVALIILLAFSKYRGRSNVSLYSRTVPDETLQRSIGLFVFVFTLITLGTFCLTITENQNPTGEEHLLKYMFEAASAFNTVGLTMNVTPTLSDSGKWLVIGLMFLGRVGPMTFAAAIAMADHPASRRFRFAKEEVVIG
jgi:trk system potassium uptake protein